MHLIILRIVFHHDLTMIFQISIKGQKSESILRPLEVLKVSSVASPPNSIFHRLAQHPLSPPCSDLQVAASYDVTCIVPCHNAVINLIFYTLLVHLKWRSYFISFWKITKFKIKIKILTISIK